MATEQIASMLDELMGRNRNFAPDDANARELKWSDPEVCKFYLVEFCPHDLFTNTKADLGPCGKIHDDALKAKFAEEKEERHNKKAQVIEDFLKFCQRMLSDLAARIRKANERLQLTQEKEERLAAEKAISPTGGLASKETDEKILLLSEKISSIVKEAEEAGCQGNVEQAQGLMKLCDQLREEREDLKRTAVPPAAAALAQYKEEYAAQQKAMEVCDVCGAFLIVGDAPQRIDDHLLGKQHVGYARLRAAVERIHEERRKLREARQQAEDERRKKREEEERKALEERRKRREKEREDQRHRDRRDRPRHGRRSRSRSRDRRDRRRSRSRDRHRDRDNRRRSRSRDRTRKRSRDRHRSRDRDRGSKRARSRSRSGRRSEGREHSKSKRSRSRSRDRRHSKSQTDDPPQDKADDGSVKKQNGHGDASPGVTPPTAEPSPLVETPTTADGR